MFHQLWKDWGTTKTVVLIQIKVATCFNQVHFKTCKTLKAKTTCVPVAKKKTSFFSRLCQHSIPLSPSAGLAVNQKGVLSVRRISAWLGVYAVLSWQTMWFSLWLWFCLDVCEMTWYPLQCKYYYSRIKCVLCSEDNVKMTRAEKLTEEETAAAPANIQMIFNQGCHVCCHHITQPSLNKIQ